jgi:hypothetical protein
VTSFVTLPKHLANEKDKRPAHMKRLYELSTTPTKIWKPFPGGDHNSSVLETGYFEAIADFVGNLDVKEKL